MIKPSQERIQNSMYWDRAWSLVEGCRHVSEECDHCWAERQAALRQHNPQVDYRYLGVMDGQRFNGSARMMWRDADKPLHVKKPQVWAIWNDLFHSDVDDNFIDQVFCNMFEAPRHTYIICTKRARRMLEFTRERRNEYELQQRPNIIGMVTAGTQKAADSRLPDLMQTDFASKGVSVEPCLEVVDLGHYLALDDTNGTQEHFERHGWGYDEWSGGFRQGDSCYDPRPGIALVTNGGETGPGARPMPPAAPRLLRDQCRPAQTSFFFKGWGEWYPVMRDAAARVANKDNSRWHNWPDEGDESPVSLWVGKKKAGRWLDNRTWDEFPG
jgi:protein gp37